MDGRVEFENEVRAQLDEWAAIVGRLRAKVEDEHGDIRMNLMIEIERLVAYQRRAETYLQELHDAQSDAWKNLKPYIESTRDEMRQALDRAWKLIMIAPTTARGTPGEGAAEDTSG